MRRRDALLVAGLRGARSVRGEDGPRGYRGHTRGRGARSSSFSLRASSAARSHVFGVGRLVVLIGGRLTQPRIHHADLRPGTLVEGRRGPRVDAAWWPRIADPWCSPVLVRRPWSSFVLRHGATVQGWLRCPWSAGRSGIVVLQECPTRRSVARQPRESGGVKGPGLCGSTRERRAPLRGACAAPATRAR
jgi:hypothetical protein